jgi:hypothetical protein
LNVSDYIIRNGNKIIDIFQDYTDNGSGTPYYDFLNDFSDYNSNTISNYTDNESEQYISFLNVYTQEGGYTSSDSVRKLNDNEIRIVSSNFPKSSKYKALLDRAMKKKSRKQKGGDTRSNAHTYTPKYTNGDVVAAFNDAESSSYSGPSYGNAQVYNTEDTSNTTNVSSTSNPDKNSNSLLATVHRTLDTAFSGIDNPARPMPLGNVCTYGINPTTGRPIRATCPDPRPQRALTIDDIPHDATYYSGEGGSSASKSKSSRQLNKKSPTSSRMARKSSRRSTRKATKQRKGSRRSTRRTNRK